MSCSQVSPGTLAVSTFLITTPVSPERISIAEFPQGSIGPQLWSWMTRVFSIVTLPARTWIDPVTCRPETTAPGWVICSDPLAASGTPAGTPVLLGSG